QDLPEDLSCEFLRVAALAHAADESLLEWAETALALPGRHRPAQAVRLTARETRCDDGQLHHLLLEDRHAERALEDAFDLGAWVGHRLLPAPPAQVRVNHVALDRAGSDDRYLDHEVVIALGSEPRQHRHLCE